MGIAAILMMETAVMLMMEIMSKGCLDISTTATYYVTVFIVLVMVLEAHPHHHHHHRHPRHQCVAKLTTLRIMLERFHRLPIQSFTKTD